MNHISQVPDGSLSTNQPAVSAPYHKDVLAGCVAIVVPVLLVAGFFAYRKHCTYRLKRQINRLEKLWLLDSTKRSS